MEQVLANLQALGAPSTQFNLDVVWTLITGFLVFFMQAGFAMVEAGFIQAKHVGNVLMKNLLDFAMGAIAFWVVGFGLMFGHGNGFIGHDGFMPTPNTDPGYAAQQVYDEQKLADNGMTLTFAEDGSAVLSGEGVTPEIQAAFTDASGRFVEKQWWVLTFFLFQLVFAATAATIVSGAMAGRTKFVAYLIYSFVVSLVIYPISGHWAWGGLGGMSTGWLGDLGYLDFAGSGVVHMVGGFLAIVGAILLGPRIGKYGKDGKPKAILGHNLPIAALGVFILWFGWYGFNPGSTTAGIPSTGWIAVTTTMGGAAGTLGALFTAWIILKTPDIGMTFNGALAGLVAITAPCDGVTPGAAIIIGLVSGILVVLGVLFVERVLKIDDPVGAFSVHGINGAWGVLSAGLFNTSSGLFYGHGWHQLGVQAIGVVSIAGWAIATGLVLFLAIKATVGLRVSKEEELMGLDLGEHKAEAYPDFRKDFTKA